MFDIILGGGTIIDGSGQAAFTADIGICGQTIQALDDLTSADAASRVNVSGLVVTPGFIDIHTHSDAILLADGRADSQIYQGVTSEVVGQCGFSFAPVSDPERMQRWMPGILPGIDISWRSFGGYLDRLTEQALGLNVYAMVGHGALHGAVLGDDLRPPNEAEHRHMLRLLEESLEEGAWGLSTGLEYWPGLGASTPELARFCKIVAGYDRLYASHVRNRDIFYDLGFGEAIALGRVAGVRTQISHIQPKYGRPDFAMEHTLAMIDQARSVGVDIAFDVIPHEWSHTSVAAALPSWARAGGTKALLQRLQDPELREAMKDNPAPMWRLVTDRKWERIILYHCQENLDLIGKTIAEIGELRGCDPFDAVLDLLLEEGDQATQMHWTSLNFFEEDLHLCLAHPECGVMSDTLALCKHGPTEHVIGSLAGYGWAARFLEHYVRQKQLISLEEAIRRLSTLPAERLGIKDRGLLRVGAYADITVFDYEDVAFRCTVTEPRQHPSGFKHVLVNGQFALHEGQRTSHHAGEVVRA